MGTVKINTKDLMGIIEESVKRILNETTTNTDPKTYYLMKWDYRLQRGQYRPKTIREYFNEGVNGKTFLIWSYYCRPNIDFEDDIKEALGIETIPKPGENPELGEKIKEKLFSNSSAEEVEKAKSMGLRQYSNIRGQKRGLMKFSDVTSDKRDNVENSKATLAWKNQGH